MRRCEFGDNLASNASKFARSEGMQNVDIAFDREHLTFALELLMLKMGGNASTSFDCNTIASTLTI
jgi:hypothetical protein